VFMPMAISFVGASIIWRFVYAYRPTGEDQIGILNGLVTLFGGEPVNWLQQVPLNSFLLMVVLIWVQTGFAMVILSAAIKGVPTELTEAAKVDGATDSQIFWKITLPQIAPTVGVVVTALFVTVMKVFDIVYAMTNGNFGTQVIANQMWITAFGQSNLGLGSALAVVLFVSVIPIMWINIRRMQRERVA
jgi:alpha-glucoside transport system permease protein